MRLTGLVAVVALVVAGVSAAAPSTGVASLPTQTPLSAGPNVLLITLDTLRADRLASYGYTEIETPVTDSLAREGVRFAEVTSPAPITLPAHSSLLTGLYPFHTGVRDNGTFVLDGDMVTLAEVLAESGYTTAGFVAAFVLDERFGIAQGFQQYTSFAALEGEGDRLLSDMQREGGEVVAEATEWLEQAPTPFFGWVHLYDPHTPYEPPEPWATTYADRPYDGEVAYTDTLVGRLMESLRSSGHSEDTLVVVTADHGEGLGEHREEWHTFFVYDSTVRVPLVMWAPGRLPAGTVVAGQASLVDVLPTILGLLGVPDPVDARDGVDLRDAMRMPDAAGRGVYSESLVPLLHFGWSELRAWRDGAHKLIAAPRPEIYDVRADPQELRDLSTELGGRLAEMEAALAAVAGDDDPAAFAAGQRPMDPETLERLRALGYIGGGGVSNDLRHVDPKDKILVFEGFNDGIDAAIEAVAEERWSDAERELLLLDGLAPDHFIVQYYLGRALLGMGRLAEATQRLEEALRLNTSYSFTYVQLASAYRLAGESERALELLGEARRIMPDVTTFPMEIGFILHDGGRFDEALAAYREAEQMAPDHPQLLRNMADLHVRRGEPERAVEKLARLVEVAPDDGAGWGELGVLQARLQRLSRAADAFAQAARLLPDDPRVHFNRGLVLLRLDRREEAVASLQRALSVDPDFEEARRLLVRLGVR